ncbi:ROK family protein [Pontibacter chitinilyticus]|uniref:ROK family protein n=1 Tax=Pontibacter chitinilyticus TaxID=2674989 RepID=UPI00321C2EBB
MDNGLVLGVDIGGSHITAALVNLQARAILPETLTRTYINAHSSAHDIISAWATTMQMASGQLPTTSLSIGIAMPGPFDYENGVSKMQGQDKYDALYDQNVRDLLAERLDMERQHIRFMNDAACFLQGEVFGGAAQGFQHVIGLTLGTGLGSARYHGHMAEDAALWCSPFLDSIAEEYLVTRWFVNHYQRRTGTAVSGVRELVADAAANTETRALFEEYGRNLGNFLANFIAIDKPEAVVIGGNIARAMALFQPHAEKVLADRALTVPLFQSTLAEEAALIGAASCWSTN